MKKFAQLTFLIIFAAFIAFSCDSVTNPDIDQRSGSANLTMGSGQGTEGEHDNSADIIDVDEDSFADNWGVVKESGETGSVEFVGGPDSPIIGEGSAKFTLEADEDGVALIGAIFEGSIPIANLETLEYNTYQPEDFISHAVSLQFNILYDDDENQEWQGRLIFNPTHEGTIESDTWQSWNALTQNGWRIETQQETDTCVTEYCTWDEVTANFHNAFISSDSDNNGTGQIIFKAGSEWGAFEGYVDGFTIDFNDELLTYNFQSSESDDDENGDNGDQDENGDNGDNGDQDENGDNGDNGDNDDQDENGNDTENGENGEEDDNNPTVKEDCKNGGWAEYGFRNQGQCVRYVNTGQDSREEEEEENGDDENGDETDDQEEEQADDPSSIEECKNGGWEAFGFRNQGQCVRYVNTGKDSRDDSDSDDDTENGNDENGTDNGDDNDEENGDENNENGNDNNGDNGSNNNGDNNNDNNGDDQNGDNGDENEDSGVTGDDEEQNDPETADDCRQGGWQEFGFKNQGQCIQFVNTGRDNR